jgi:YVTN family beta-propeller protein
VTQFSRLHALVVLALLASSCSSHPREHAAVAPSGLNVYAHTGARDVSPAVRGVPSRVYVPNINSNTVDVIDPATFRIVDHFDVGKLPEHVTPSWDLKHLYVDNDISNSLTPIDPATGARGAPFFVGDPYNLYFTPDGNHAIVIAERFRRLGWRETKTWKLVKSLDIPHAGPNHLDFTADGKYLLISCEFSGYVVRVDVATMSVVDDLKVGGKPADVRLSPDGSVFFVANEKRGGVDVVDPIAMREVGFIETAQGAHGFVVSRDAKSLYVTNRSDGSISVIDFASRRVTATWKIGGHPDMGGVSIDGKQLWVSGRYDGSVYVVNTTTGALIKSIKVGDGPHGICVFPQPGRYSLGHTGNYR